MPLPTASQTKAKAKRVASLGARFQAAHKKGMQALRRHDYDGLSEVIAEEKSILETQASLINEQRRTAAAFARRLSAATARSSSGTTKKAAKQSRTKKR